MLSALQSLSKAERVGESLPRLEQLRELHEGFFRWDFQRAQTTVIAGEPGTQKSGLATWLCSQWRLPTLFFSADTDQLTAVSRLTAAVTGDRVRDVSWAITCGNGAYYEDAMADIPVRFVYKPEPDFEDIYAQLHAWVEAWDAWPQVIVLDNMLDIVPPAGDNEFSGYKVILLECKRLARETGAAVLVLHHMSEAVDTDGKLKKPPKRSRLMGKASQTPENILSIALEDEELLVCPVKHRTGPSDKRAERWVSLRADPERNRFEKWVPLQEQVDQAVREFWEGVE